MTGNETLYMPYLVIIYKVVFHHLELMLPTVLYLAYQVKCEIKFKGVEAVTDRIDITNRVNNGDFNPSQMHVLEYLRQTILKSSLKHRNKKHNSRNR